MMDLDRCVLFFAGDAVYDARFVESAVSRIEPIGLEIAERPALTDAELIALRLDLRAVTHIWPSRDGLATMFLPLLHQIRMVYGGPQRTWPVLPDVRIVRQLDRANRVLADDSPVDALGMGLIEFVRRYDAAVDAWGEDI